MGLVDQRRYKCTSKSVKITFYLEIKIFILFIILVGRDYPAPVIKLAHEWKQTQIDKATKVDKPKKSDFDNYLDFDNY